MDTSLYLPAPSALTATSAPVSDRSVTTKVAPIEARDSKSTRPAEKPFVAQVVNARLSGTEFPRNPSEIAPQDRTLRPYDVPMLPSTSRSDTPELPEDAGQRNVAAAIKNDP